MANTLSENQAEALELIKAARRMESECFGYDRSYWAGNQKIRTDVANALIKKRAVKFVSRTGGFHLYEPA